MRRRPGPVQQLPALDLVARERLRVRRARDDAERREPLAERIVRREAGGESRVLGRGQQGGAPRRAGDQDPGRAEGPGDGRARGARLAQPAHADLRARSSRADVSSARSRRTCGSNCSSGSAGAAGSRS